MTKENTEQRFKGLQERLEKAIGHKKPEDGKERPAPPAISDLDLAADLGTASPLAIFVRHVREACPTLLQSEKPDTPADAPNVELRSTEQAFFVKLDELIRANRGTMTSPRARKLTKALCDDDNFKNLQIARDLECYTRLEGLDSAINHIIRQQTMTDGIARSVQGLAGGIAPSQSASDKHWQQLASKLDEAIESKSCACELIYSYWLDEGGLHFASERVADRIENGITATTTPLRSLHIDEASPIVDSMSSFIVTWQRGEAFDVDARRKQYQALYGYPLHAANAWRNLSTTDPRASFPAAFNRLLHEASAYYESTRDLQRKPDPSPARSAIGQLIDALEEGNEHMRRKRTTEIRGQTEYCKRLIGGSDPSTAYATEWQRYLTGRPGVDSTTVWRIKSDAIAGAYRWNRPRMKNYQALAESSETLLVAVRLLGRQVNADNDEGMTKAFLELIQPYVSRFVDAFKVVGREDLGRKLIAVPPAAILARRVPAPPVPPLKRDWGARTPQPKNTAA